MNTLERLKRKVVSRLTDEASITYFEDAIDNKVAVLNYKDREVILEKKGIGFAMFLKTSKEYYYRRVNYFMAATKEQAVEAAKRLIKDDDYWKTRR